MLWTTGGLTLNAIDLALLGVVLLGMVIGLTQGLIRQALILGVSYLSLVVAAQYYPVLADAFGYWFGGSAGARSISAIVVIFFGLALLLNTGVFYVYRQTSLPGLVIVDRLGGAGLGLVLGWSLAGLALVILSFSLSVSWSASEPERAALSTLVSRSSLAPVVGSLLPHLYDILRPWLPMGLPAPFVL